MPTVRQYYDERLVLLRRDVATLEFVPIGSDPDGTRRTDLYHIQFSQQFALEGDEAVVFLIAHSNDNIFSNSTEQISEQDLKVYAASPRSVQQVLSQLTSRDNGSSSDDPEANVKTIYRGDVKFVLDANRKVSGGYRHSS